MERYYSQAEMVKGNVHQIAWIPIKFAVVGKYLKLKGDDGWKVVDVGDVAMTEASVFQGERKYLKAFASLEVKSK